MHTHGAVACCVAASLSTLQNPVKHAKAEAHFWQNSGSCIMMAVWASNINMSQMDGDHCWMLQAGCWLLSLSCSWIKMSASMNGEPTLCVVIIRKVLVHHRTPNINKGGMKIEVNRQHDCGLIKQTLWKMFFIFVLRQTYCISVINVSLLTNIGSPHQLITRFSVCQSRKIVKHSWKQGQNFN